MTRILFIGVAASLVALNGAALLQLAGNVPSGLGVATAALIVDIVMWPLALVVAYRIGQVTGVEYLRKARARATAIKASQSGRRTTA